MRGEDNKQEAMFSYVSPEKRVPTDHPLRPIRAMVDGILKEMSPQFAKRYADVGRPSIAPERLLRVLLLQIFYSEERTAADGTAAVQLAVSVVCGDGDGRGGVEPRGVQQESGAAAERGDRRGVFPAGARAGAAVFVGRAFHGGRDADRSVGEPEEFSAEGRTGGPARCERRGRLSRREARQRNPSIHDRSRGAVI